MTRGADDLAEVVRDEIGCHAHGDTSGTVDEQVGNRSRENCGLGLAAVVVRVEVDNILVEAGGHAQCRGCQSGLGVAHRSGAIIGGSEVPVAVHHGQAEREGLGHSDEGVVDRRVAVRVQPAHDLTDDTGALHVTSVGAQTHLSHLEQDPALYGLETVTGIGQRTRVDDRVGVLEEGGSHLV